MILFTVAISPNYDIIIATSMSNLELLRGANACFTVELYQTDPATRLSVVAER